MNSVTQVVTQSFLLALAFGTQMYTPVVNTRLTGVGFFKLGTAIVLGSLVFALGVSFYMAPGLDQRHLLAFGGLIVLNIVAYLFHQDQKNLLMWGIYILELLLFTWLTFLIFQGQPLWINFFISSMALLGISNFAMILGHYYLVVPKLTEEPLIYCLFIFWIVIFLKMVSSLSVLTSVGAPFLQEGTTLGDGYMYNWLFVSMRWLWGYVAPLILSFFTFRLCKLRSIQSATGVLYIVEFFVIVGELISVYLMTKHGLPV